MSSVLSVEVWSASVPVGFCVFVGSFFGWKKKKREYSCVLKDILLRDATAPWLGAVVIRFFFYMYPSDFRWSRMQVQVLGCCASVSALLMEVSFCSAMDFMQHC